MLSLKVVVKDGAAPSSRPYQDRVLAGGRHDHESKVAVPVNPDIVIGSNVRERNGGACSNRASCQLLVFG